MTPPTAQPPRRSRSTWRAARPVPDPDASRRTGIRSSTSTTPPPPRSRGSSSTRLRHYYETAERQRPSRRPHAVGAGHRGVRGRAHRGGGLPRCRAHARDHLHPQRHRGHQPGGAELGPGEPLGRRRGAHLGDGAPLEHRAVAARLRAHRGAAAGHPDRRPRRARPRRRSTSCSPSRTRMVAVSPALERARHGEPGGGHRHGGARRRAPRCWSTARRRPITAPVDVQALGVRLLRLHRAQALRSDRHRRALRHAPRSSTRCRRFSAAAT